MDLKEAKEKSKKILSDFIDELGLDGEFYTSINNCPVVFGDPLGDGLGETISPHSKRLKKIIANSNYDKKTCKTLYTNGLIIINRDLKEAEDDKELCETIIHEMIHASRNMLIDDVTRDGSNEAAYSYNNEKFEQNSNKYSSIYADISQEIPKGNIDTSTNTINNYKEMTSDDIEDINFASDVKEEKMTNQYIVDESLVELMSILSWQLYKQKQKGLNFDIWKSIDLIKDAYEGEDISSMCKIMQKHHDLELFNWMLDPIGYSEGNIHYDFFSTYTKNDGELLDELYHSSNLNMDYLFEDDAYDRLGNKKITITPEETDKIIQKCKEENLQSKNINRQNNNLEK